MTATPERTSENPSLATDLKAEQALGLIGIGLMQNMSREGISSWDWSKYDNSEKADLTTLRQRLEITALAIETGAPLSTSEVAQILGAKPGSAKIERGGLIARRISRNVWKLSKADTDSSYWRN